MKITCLPSLLQLNSFLPATQRLIVEGKERSLKSQLNDNTLDKHMQNISLHKDQEGDGTKHEEIEGKALETLVKTCNNAINKEVYSNIEGGIAEGDLPQKNIAKEEVLLEALEGANKDLAKRTIANHIEDLNIRRRNPMSVSVNPNYVESSKVDDSFEAFKKTLAYDQGKPNIATIESHKDNVFALSVAGDLLYTASDSKGIRLFRAPIFEELDCFGSGNGVVQSLMAFEDKLYSAHQDNKIRVWKRVKNGDDRCKHKLMIVLPRLEDRVKSMLLTRNYVQVRRHKKVLWFEHADRISALALGSGRSSEAGGGGWSPPSVLYSASWDKTVKVWSLNNFKCMESFHAHHDAINAMIVIDGGVLATASADHTIKLWTKISHSTRKKKHGLINTLQGHKAAVNALAISQNFKMLYSGSSDGTVIAWKKVYSCKPQSRSSIKRAISGSLSGEVLRQNGRGTISRTSSLASTNYTGIRSNLSGEVVINIGSSGSGESISRANSLSNQGLSSIKKVISYYNRLGALSSNCVNFIKKKVLIGHTRAVLSVSTVGDDITCSSSADKTIRVWGRSAGEKYACIAVLAGHGGPVKSIAAVSPRAHSHSSIILHEAAASHYPLDAEEEDDDRGVIVYSAGLDSKVKVWALNVTR